MVQSIESRKVRSGIPSSTTFLDEDFGKLYSSEERLGDIFTVFAALAIIIASLGLFALTSFTAEQRTKEIGIRKCSAPAYQEFVILLSKEFASKLIIIAFVLAAPVALYGINWWLEGYSYKTEIGVLVYVFAGLAAFGVAWLTMGFQSIRAALAILLSRFEVSSGVAFGGVDVFLDYSIIKKSSWARLVVPRRPTAAAWVYG